MDLVEAILKPQFMVMVLAAIATFVTVLTIALPVLQKDRMGQRMKVMATERDKMRQARLAELSKEGAGRLRQAPKGFMQQIVNQLNLRNSFESEEVKNQLKMAGLRGQAPLVAYMFFRLVAPIIVTIVALFYLFLAIQECIDLAAHWVADEGWMPPDDAGSTFDVLADHEVIDRPTADALHGAAGLRNRIAHGYAMLDYARVQEESRAGVPALRALLDAVARAAGL